MSIRDRIATPWGESQSAQPYGAEVTFYDTPSHGGFRVMGSIADRLRSTFPALELTPALPIGSERRRGIWLEEDCEYCLAVVVAPELFSAREVAHAVGSFERWYTPGAGTYSQDAGAPAPAAALEIAAKWNADNADRWEVGSMGSAPAGSPPKSWSVSFRRIGDGARRWGIWPSYPSGPTFTSRELDEAGIAPAAEVA